MDKFSAYANNSIIYHAPPVSWWQGWLLGNGSGGATIWNPEDKICFQLGHTDLLDRTEDNSIDACGIPNTRHSLRGSININNMPLFDTFYIKDYNAITDISTGVMDMCGESEFGEFNLTSFYCDKPDVFALKYSDKTTEKAIRSLNLEKMGSRFFSRIWTGTVRDTSHGKGTTQIKAIGDILLFSHEKEDFKMATAVKFSSNTNYTNYTGEYTEISTFDPTDEFEVTLLATLGYADTLEAAEKISLEKMNNIENSSFEDLRKTKENNFKSELPDTQISLPQDRYYENLWYTSRYNMRICYKGHYPAFFINGPFGGNRDKREWSDCWLHWNMHASHQGIIKNGDYDLFKAYADYKMHQIPSAKKLAENSYGCHGMVTQDQQKPDGGNRGKEDDYFKLQVFPSLHTVIHFY